MGIVDFILNLAGLLLWLNWRSKRLDPLVKRLPLTLMGTLRPATPRNQARWQWLGAIAGLLLLRALVYWTIVMPKSVKLDLGLVVLWFSNNSHWTGFCHLGLFSFLSFGVLLGVFYIWILLLSLLAGPPPIHGLVVIPLGRVDGWPGWIKVILPGLVTALAWWLASWWLCRQQIVPPISVAGRWEQAFVLGLSSYLQWQYPVGIILGLHLLNSYIYFGKHPFWKYVTAAAQTLLQPMRKVPLRVGQVDFAPVAGIILLLLAAHGAESGLLYAYRKLPL